MNTEIYKNKVDLRRRTLTKVAWATPIITIISLPAHAQTSATTTVAPTTSPAPLMLECNKTARCGDGVVFSCIFGDDTIDQFNRITDIQATVSPATPGVLLRCTVTTNDSDFPMLASETAITNTAGTARFPDIPEFGGGVLIPNHGTLITLTTTIDSADTTGATLIGPACESIINFIQSETST